MTNPTEKREPGFIRDITAAETAGFEFGSLEKLAELVKPFHHSCEYCGLGPFPLWPMKEWAEHLLTHRDIFTVQQEQAITLFNVEGFTPAVSQWLSMQMLTRVDLRRRAYELGILRLAKPAETNKPRIHMPS